MAWSNVYALRDGYHRLGLASVILVIAIAAVETYVPNAQRLSPANWREAPIDFLPRTLEWQGGTVTGWASALFDYRLAISSALSLAFVLLLINARCLRHLRAIDESTRVERSTIEKEFKQFDNETQRVQRRRTRIVQPAMGALFITLLAWLAAVIIASKADPSWVRPFLPPPLLIAQNLQHFGGDYFVALVRSSWHMAQAVLLGTLGGLVLGFVLSQVSWLQRWTTWHLAIMSALPPFVLAEVFRQIVRTKWFPVFGAGEVAFKLGIAMAAWAVLWPVLTATALAVSSIDAEYRRSIRLLGARSVMERLIYIDLPFVMPPVLANLRVGFVIGLIVLLYGESYGSPRGSCLGFWFSETTNNYKLQSLVALIIFMSALVLLFEAVLKVIEPFFIFSRRRYGSFVPVQSATPPSVAEQRRKCIEHFEVARRSALGLTWKRVDWTRDARAALFQISSVTKKYGDRLVFQGPTEVMSVPTGSFVSVIGKSGAGKSTFLKLLLGFEKAEVDTFAGVAPVLRLGGVDLVTGGGTKDKSQTELEEVVAYVAQRPLLLPHRTVGDNILFGLRQQWKHLAGRDDASRRLYAEYMTWLLGVPLYRGLGRQIEWAWPRTENNLAAAEGGVVQSPLGLLVRFMGLADKMFNYPAELSGGEAQRVHLLRWLILCRPILIMDEAFSALDQPLKGMVRDAIHRHVKELGISVINVSHDRADVLQISDTIVYVDEGRILANRTPRGIFFEPPTEDLAVFLGHTNLFRVTRNGAPDTIDIERDEYRDIDFVDPRPLLRVSGAPRAPKLFIPRSFVNIDRLARVPPGDDPQQWFRIESLKFTGTHYDVRLVRQMSHQCHFRLDAVIQDDDLAKLAGAAELPDTELSNLYAHVSIHRAIALGEHSV